MHRTSWRLAAAFSIVAAAACRPEFQLKNLTSNEALWTASLNEYQHKHWDNAITGFEKLTTDLPARDTLLPRSYWYLASAHQHQDEYLLAAQSFSRLVESFPDDSLADDAALEAARSYSRLWRKPQLDPMYGETALASYNTLIGLYPTSPLIPVAQKEIAELENKFAIKDYDAGMYYFRRKAYDSGMLYFKYVLAKYATVPKARDAALRLVESYKANRYREDASDLCTQLRQRYPGDSDVKKVCTGVPNTAATVRADSAKLDSTLVRPIKPPPHGS
ncbi:MAG TPA: outer membrane protein assembly factor BamD [Gemmatimonadaceae bacterium]|nr:outer membrane protein assembly factor BamD [Gemmatimonadaceae bacterium]